MKRLKHFSWKLTNFKNFLLVFAPFGHIRPIRGAYKLHKSKLGMNGQTIYLEHDKVFAPFVNKFGFWDIGMSNFISEYLNTHDGNHLFIDIGSNQGLISMQVANNLSNLTNNQFICIEPVLKYFDNLKKNMYHLESGFYTLYNFGLGNLSNPNVNTYVSKRNATSTHHLSLARDSKKNLEIIKISIISVDNFIDNYLASLIYDDLIIKSDTDGNDIEIFNSFASSKIYSKISCYILEVILENVTESNLKVFIANCNQFSNWVLINKNEKIEEKKEILTKLHTKYGYIGDLFLTNRSS